MPLYAPNNPGIAIDETGLVEGSMIKYNGTIYIVDTIDNVVSGQTNVNTAYTHSQENGNPHSTTIDDIVGVEAPSPVDGAVLQFSVASGYNWIPVNPHLQILLRTLGS